MQIRHEEFLLFGSLVQKLQGQSSFSIVREALRIRLSVFWLRTSPNNFYQNFRSVNIPNKEIEYQNSYLSRRHVVAGKVNQGGSDSNRYSVFSLQHLGFITNLKKSILTPQQKIEFLGLLVGSLNMSLSLTPEKLMKVTSQCLGMYKTEKVSILQLTKLIGLLRLTTQEVLPAQPQSRYLQQIQVESISRDPSYQHQVTLISSAKQELVQPQAQMVI